MRRWWEKSHVRKYHQTKKEREKSIEKLTIKSRNNYFINRAPSLKKKFRR